MVTFDISVVIPCYNAGTELEACVCSVLGQVGDFSLLEIIVVNDSSTDECTLRTLSRIATFDKVRVVLNSGPRGSGGARNAGLAVTKAEWVLFFDADDVLAEHAIQTLCTGAREFPDCGWVGGDFLVWNVDGTFERKPFLQSRPRPAEILRGAFESGKPILLQRPVREFVAAGLCHMCTSLVRKTLIDEIGGFDASLRRQQDYHYYLRLACVSDYVFVPCVIMYYRQHANTVGKSEIDDCWWRIQGLKKLLDMPAFRSYAKDIKVKMSEHYLALAYHGREAREVLNALAAAVRAVKYGPSSIKAWRCLIGTILGR